MHQTNSLNLSQKDPISDTISNKNKEKDMSKTSDSEGRELSLEYEPINTSPDAPSGGEPTLRRRSRGRNKDTFSLSQKIMLGIVIFSIVLLVFMSVYNALGGSPSRPGHPKPILRKEDKSDQNVEKNKPGPQKEKEKKTEQKKEENKVDKKPPKPELTPLELLRKYRDLFMNKREELDDKKHQDLLEQDLKILAQQRGAKKLTESEFEDFADQKTKTYQKIEAFLKKAKVPVSPKGSFYRYFNASEIVSLIKKNSLEKIPKVVDDYFRKNGKELKKPFELNFEENLEYKDYDEHRMNWIKSKDNYFNLPYFKTGIGRGTSDPYHATSNIRRANGEPTHLNFTIHILPHSHMDTGWQITYKECSRSNNL